MSYTKPKEHYYKSSITFTATGQYQTILPADTGKFFILTGLYYTITNDVGTSMDCRLSIRYGSANTDLSTSAYLITGIKSPSINTSGKYNSFDYYVTGSTYGAILDLTYPITIYSGIYTTGRTVSMDVIVKGIKF